VRMIVLSILTCGFLAAQDNPVPAVPAEQAPGPPTVSLDIPPLSPPDLDSPYASPRDAARHRFQATLAELQSSRNLKAALQGFADAFSTDRAYAAAAFNLGVVAAIAGKWEDALAALQEAARIDPGGLGKTAAPQIERLRLICSLEATADGQRRRRYDEALYPVLANLAKLQPGDAMAALADVGRIDSRRWEAPALIAGLNGNGRTYDVAARFLEISVANATDAGIKSRLEHARQAAERELRYTAARATADAAADRAEYGKAGELYEAAWAVIPARASNGMEAASAWLLQDDTARAATLLARLRECGNPELVYSAGAMLKQLEPIEAGAKAPAAGTRDFFRDAGSTEPVHISDLLPPVDPTEMEVLARPLPKLVQDAEPVVLLSALSANAAEAAQNVSLPVLPAPRVAGENPWRELSQLQSAAAGGQPAPQTERPVETVDLSKGARNRRSLQVTSQPSGARIFIGDQAEPACQSPCTIQAATGSYTIRVSLAGYLEKTQQVRIPGDGSELQVPLQLIRGNLIVETSVPATLKVNGTAIANPAPIELSLLPGLYRIGADFGSATRERLIAIKPGAHLRLTLRP
jgi:PEGA domain